MVSDQMDIYEKSLKLTISEIKKCVRNLNNFLEAEDMHNFSIELHGMKGSLANIGAMNLSAKALELELASAKDDSAFCASNLPDFTKRLEELKVKLQEAFAEKRQNLGPIEIPPELPRIFERLKNAFDEMDFVAIDNEIENMDALNLNDALKEDTEQIKDAVQITDYESAMSVIERVLSSV
jgi:HPt (histidine-containing phosphotransfer) domain-containing protein